MRRVITQPGDGKTVVRAADAAPDAFDAVAQSVRVAFGIVSMAIDLSLRALRDERVANGTTPGPRVRTAEVVDLVVGSAWGAARLSGRCAAIGVRVASPALRLAARPPLVPRRLQPGYRAQVLAARWQRDRPDAERSVAQWSSTAVPAAVEVALAQVDVDRLLIDVVDRVDLDRLVAHVLRRLDLDQLAAELLGRLAMDPSSTSSTSPTWSSTTWTSVRSWPRRWSGST